MNIDQSSNTSLKIAMNLLTIALMVIGLYFGRTIFTPLFFAILLAMVLNPVVAFLSRKKVDRVLAILLCVLFALSIILGIVYFFSLQIAGFLDDVPALKTRLHELVSTAKLWVRENFNLTIREQNELLNKTTSKITEGNPALVQNTFVTLTSVVSYLIFLPVYTFLVLYHKDLILRALTEMFKKGNESKVIEVLFEAEYMAQRYVLGLLIETTTVFALNAAGFLLLGIKYPIFLALMAAILNMVPYIGMVIANILCALITLVSADPSFNVLWVVGVLGVVQIIDNNILMPFIVGSQIKINALALIVAVLIGGALCGVPGMFLAVPGLAMLKVIFEKVESLRPWAVLLGDDTTAALEHKNPLKATFLKARKHVEEKRLKEKREKAKAKE